MLPIMRMQTREREKTCWQGLSPDTGASSPTCSFSSRGGIITEGDPQESSWLTWSLSTVGEA